MGRIEAPVIRYQPKVPTPPQAEFLVNLTDPGFTGHCFVGAGGAGKTQAECQAIIECGVSIPGNEIVILRKTGKDLRRTTYREFMDTVDPHLILQERVQEMEVLLRSKDPRYPSRLTFAGMDDPNRFGSTFFGQAFMDEANEFDYRDFVTIRQRLRHRPPADVDLSESPFGYYDEVKGRWEILTFVVCVTNPIPNPDHWLRQLYTTKSVGNTKYRVTVVRATTMDNAANLSDRYLDMLDEQPESERARMKLGKDTPGVTGPPCCPSFDEEKHTFAGAVPKTPISITRGWDFGWGHASVTWGQVIDKSAIYIWQETFSAEKTLRQLITDFVLPQQREFHPNCDYAEWVDHRAANQHTDKSRETSKSIMRDMGFAPRHRYSKPKDRADLLDDLIRSGRLYVHRRCLKTIAALNGYWHRDAETGEPEKDGYWDHIGDSLGYLANGVFGPKGRVVNQALRAEEALTEDELDRRRDEMLLQKFGRARGRFHLPGMGRAS